MVASPTLASTVAADDSAATVRLFTGAADVAGASAWRLQIEDGMTIRDAFFALCQAFSPVSSFAGRLLFALNGEYAGSQALVRPGDEVCLVTPVGGGATG